jgi:hypothetical protein
MKASLVDFAYAVWVLFRGLVQRCAPVLLVAVAISGVLLFVGQGFETVIADLSAKGEVGFGLLASSIFLGVLVFLSSNVMLRGWEPAYDDRYKAFARYSGPLVLSIIATWVIPACVAALIGLHVELNSLRLGFLFALAGGIVAIALMRYLMSQAAAKEAGAELFRIFVKSTPQSGSMLVGLHRVFKGVYERVPRGLTLGLLDNGYSLAGMMLGMVVLVLREFEKLDDARKELEAMLGSSPEIDEIEPLLWELARWAFSPWSWELYRFCGFSFRTSRPGSSFS